MHIYPFFIPIIKRVGKQYAFVNNHEQDGAKKMLVSAALTYVASVIATVMELLRLVLVFSRRD